MQLSLTELQQMIEDSVADYLTQEYDFLKRAASVAAPQGINTTLWQGFADMGWLGLPLSEDDGGIGGGLMESALLMRQFGRALVIEPYLNSVLLGTRLLAQAGSGAQRERSLAPLIAGETRLVLAHEENGVIDAQAPRRTQATRCEQGYRLHGTKTLVQGAPGAQALLVSAQLQTGQGSFTGLWHVPLDTAGVSVRSYVTLDGSHAADITLHQVQLPAAALLGEQEDAAQENLLHRALAEALIAQCWEAAGAMRAALEQTADYTRQRQQFGRAIGDFQVVQHRLAEMAVCCEDARAVCELAVLKSQRDPGSVQAMASLAKAKVGRESRFVAQQAVQLHGAMGVSEELAISGYFRKLLAFSQQQGDSQWHTQRYARQLLASGDWQYSQTLADHAAATTGD